MQTEKLGLFLLRERSLTAASISGNNLAVVQEMACPPRGGGKRGIRQLRGHKQSLTEVDNG